MFARIFISIILFFVFKTGYAQKEYNDWYFGFHAGITFDAGQPVSLINSAISQGEGCASICDSSSNMLFYTDGSTVWNKNHVIMADGLINGSGNSCTQAALIVQRPLCKRFYYIFTVAPNAHPIGANYAIVDIEAEGGLGRVVSKSNYLTGPVAEKLTAIRHQNGVDVWIIMHGMENNTFISYLLTRNGVSQPSVNTDIGAIHKENMGFVGHLKPNPRGTVLASALYDISNFELFTFNRATGYLCNQVIIGTNIVDTTGPDLCYYGFEFSANGQFLYSKMDSDSLLFQFNVSQLDSVAITQSKVPLGIINSSGPIKFRTGAIQTGPDRKLYIARVVSEVLGCINNPNLPGLQCNFIDSAVYLNGKICAAGLPNNPFTAPYIQQDGCFTGTYTFHLTDTTPYQRWDFGDPLQTGDTALQANPAYTYTQSGVYTVTCVYLTDWQTFDTVITTVYAHPVPDILGLDTLFVCNSDSLKILADSAYDQYQWSTGADTSFAWVQQSGKYYITATEACGCAVKDSITIVFTLKPELGADTSLCPEETIVLHASVLSSSYTWSNGSTASSIQVNQPGLYWLELKDGNCTRRDSIIVGAIEISLDIGKDTLLCEGEELEITANGDFETIIWENGSTTLSHIVSQSGWVSAIATKAQCNTTDSLYIRPCSQIRFPNVFTPNGDQKNDLFIPEYTEIYLYKLLIFNRWGQELFRSNDPMAGWNGRFNGQECQSGTYYYSATYQFKDHHGTKEITQTGTMMLLR